MYIINITHTVYWKMAAAEILWRLFNMWRSILKITARDSEGLGLPCHPDAAARISNHLLCQHPAAASAMQRNDAAQSDGERSLTQRADRQQSSGDCVLQWKPAMTEPLGDELDTQGLSEMRWMFRGSSCTQEQLRIYCALQGNMRAWGEIRNSKSTLKFIETIKYNSLFAMQIFQQHNPQAAQTGFVGAEYGLCHSHTTLHTAGIHSKLIMYENSAGHEDTYRKHFCFPLKIQTLVMSLHASTVNTSLINDEALWDVLSAARHHSWESDAHMTATCVRQAEKPWDAPVFTAEPCHRYTEPQTPLWFIKLTG